MKDDHPRKRAVRFASAIFQAGVAADVVVDDLLGVTFGVKVRGVDEVAAQLDVAVDDVLRLFDARAPAEFFTEGHRAEARRTDAQAGPAERHVMIETHRTSKLELVKPGGAWGTSSRARALCLDWADPARDAWAMCLPSQPVLLREPWRFAVHDARCSLTTCPGATKAGIDPVRE